jgi:uncharacterized protein
MADQSQIPHVTAFGTAITEVVPDQLLWTIRVRNQGLMLEDVAKQHTKLVETVMTLLKNLKLEEKSIQTSRMEFGENWDHRSGARIRDGYFASTAISFKVVDFELDGKIWFSLAKTPEVTVENVTYDHSKRIKLPRFSGWLN